MKAEDQTILTLHNKVVTHNSRISVTHDNHRTWQLHIRQVKESDRGCYMCQINTSVMKKQIGCVDVHGKFEGKIQTTNTCIRRNLIITTDVCKDILEIIFPCKVGDRILDRKQYSRFVLRQTTKNKPTLK